jgi:acetyl-CoA synthetase
MKLGQLLAPRSIAVVGATDRPSAYGDIILRNLERIGFDGPIWGVNPKRDEIRGIPCFASLADLPEPADAVAVAVPAPKVPATVASAADAGCGGAVVISAGFGEVEGGRELERELRQTALGRGFPVCGPNGNGIISFARNAAIWGDAVRPMPPGPVAMISQSGNVAVNALNTRRGINFHTVISTGNGAVCDPADWLFALCERDGVGSVAMFLESDGDGQRLAEALACCAERRIRVAVLKSGASEAGAAAAAAHTGALAGDERVFRALVEEAGASWARNPHELLELARVLAEPRARPRGGGGLAILTCSGGDSGIAADEAERLGVELPPFGAETGARLRELLPDAATVANPLDYTPLIWAQTALLAEIVETAGSDPGIDQVLVFHDTPLDLPADSDPSWNAHRAGIAEGLDRAPAAPLMASTLPELTNVDIADELAAHGIASVGGLSTAVLCARELRRTQASPQRLREVAAVAGAERPEAGLWLSEAGAKRLLHSAGVPVPEGRRARSAEECVRAAKGIEWPIALKLTSPAIRHKSEIGAIALGIETEAQLVREAVRILSLPEAVGAELLVEEMAPSGGVELIVAARTDAVVPALVIGLGGIWAEALADVAVVPLPASPALVEAALGTLRGAPLLQGGRGRPAVDLAALAIAASRIGELLLEERLSLIEVNPLIATPEGVTAADALARR